MSLETTSFEIRIGSIPVAGRLDALRAVSLRKQIDEAIEDNVVRLVVDLSDVEFVDSAGLAALANGMKACRERSGDLRIVGATHPDAERVFSLTRFDQVFVMGDTVEELVNSW